MALRLTCFHLGLAAAVVALVAPYPAGATATAEVEVSRVDFERVPGPGGRWYAAEVEVAVRPAPAAPGGFVDRVGMTLNLGFEIAAGGAGRFEFYRATAIAVALKRGRVAFRFYLPPEIVERDRITADARYYFVELTVRGEPLPTNRRHVSAALPTAEALANFQARVAAEAAANDGVLVTQPHTPFAVAFGGPPAPTFLPSP